MCVELFDVERILRELYRDLLCVGDERIAVVSDELYLSEDLLL